VTAATYAAVRSSQSRFESPVTRCISWLSSVYIATMSPGCSTRTQAADGSPHLFREPVAQVCHSLVSTIDLYVTDGEVPVVVDVRTESDLVGFDAVHVEGANEADPGLRVAHLLAVIDRLLIALGPVVGEVQAELLGGAPAPGDGIVGQVIDRFVGVEAAVRGKELSRDSLCLVLRRVARPVGTEPTPQPR
jgi:hypothetical protein